MPRASHGDRNTVTIMQGSSHVVLDLTSKVIDFVVLCGGDEIGSSGKVAMSLICTLLNSYALQSSSEKEQWNVHFHCNCHAADFIMLSAFSMCLHVHASVYSIFCSVMALNCWWFVNCKIMFNLL